MVSNPFSMGFLRAEAETSFVFAKIAADAKDEEKKRRNMGNARTGYEAILYFMSQLALTTDERDEMRIKVEELRRQLEFLGEIL